MFFVGATGQLLTLFLTVCLPFVIILSGGKKAELAKNTSLIEIQQNKISVDVSNAESVDFLDFIYAKSTLPKIKHAEGPPLKIPLLSFLLKTHSFSLKSSGNKAPPSGISFLC